MSCITKIKHNSESCTATKGLQVFYDSEKDRYTGYCFSCAARGEEAYVKDPLNGYEAKDLPKGKTKEEIEAEVAEIRALGPPVEDHRGIPAVYFARAGVRLAYSEYDGKTPFSLNFPLSESGKLLGFKTIMLDKKAMWSTGDTKGADLYNWERAKKVGAKRLYITEGEKDCHALEYILEKSSNYKYKYAVTSIPTGASGAVQVIGRMSREINELFKEVVLVFDNDEAGYGAVREVQKVFPSVLEAPSLSGVKDACEAVEKGQTATFADFCIWKARKPPMEGVVTVSQAMERGEKSPESGRSLPWPTLSEVMYGQRDGEATCVAGGVGGGKCQGYNTPIVMFDGTVKMVQDVQEGEVLMGDDSTGREVLSVTKGKAEMFKVIPNKGDTYTFNGDHILAIKMTNFETSKKGLRDCNGVLHKSGEKSTITVYDYLKSSDTFKKSVKLYRTPVEYNHKSELSIPPYILGLWLGDGSAKGASLTTADSSVAEDWCGWGESIGCSVRVVEGQGCKTYFLKNKKGQLNPALELLRGVGVSENKHIPDDYIRASISERRELLAGILDTDAHVHGCCFDLTLKGELLSKQIQRVARSVGLTSELKECTKTIKSSDFSGKYWRQNITGNSVCDIPTKVKVIDGKKPNKDSLCTGFKVESIGIDDYYGFSITGNRLYVLGDFTVTHNTLICHEGAAWNMIEHNVPCFLALLEEQNIKTCWNVAAKVDSIPYNKPEVYKQNYEQYMETIKKLEDRMFLWNSAGSSSYRFDLDEIIRAIRFNYMEYGCKVAYVDNMTRVVDQMPTGEGNEFINKYSSEIANLAAELGIHIVLFSHLNPPKGKDARSHEEGGEVFAGQLTGSRGIMRSFPNLIGFERNQHAEGDKQHNSFITSLKNRDHGEKRKIKTRYNPASGRMLEHEWEGDSLY